MSFETVTKAIGGLSDTVEKKFKDQADRLDAVEKTVKKIAEQPDYSAARVSAEPKERRIVEGRFGWKNAGEQFRAIQQHAVSKGRSMDPRLSMEHVEKCFKGYHGGIEKSLPAGLSEGLGADGGFLLAPTFIDEIFRILHSTFNMMDECAVRDITGPSVKYRAVAESSRATGSRRGGVTGYWLDEADTMTASKPQFRTGELKPHKLHVLYYATEELIQDGGSFLEQEMTQFAAEEINFLVSDSILNGTGVGQPQGILTSNALVSVAKEQGQAAATLDIQNIVKMWSRLHAPSQTKAKWYVNQAVYPQLFTMVLNVGTGGVAVFMPPGGISGSPYASLMGRPVVPIEWCAALGTQGDIILADFSEYIVAKRGTINSQMSIHVEFLTDQLVYKFTFRVDGQSRWHSTLTPFKDTTKTQSPFIVLDSRS